MTQEAQTSVASPSPTNSVTEAVHAEPRIRPLPIGSVALAILLLTYTGFLLGAFAPGISDPDDNGYYAQATLLAQTGHTWFVPESDAQYIGIHWLLTPSGQYVSRYPPGLAVIIAAVYKVFGWKVAVFTNPLLALGGLAGMYFLIKQVFSRADSTEAPVTPHASIIWGVAGTMLLALNPQYLHHALAGDAHTGVACFLLWGLYFLVRWADTQKLWQAFVAGLFLGVIPTLRYADAIMGLGAVVFMLWQIRRVPRIWRHYAVAALGVAIPLVPLLIRNQLLMGAFWRTGYSLTGEGSGFGWDYFTESFLPYLQNMNSTGIGLLFGLGCIGMVTMLCLPGRRALGALLAAMSVPMLLIYMAYYWGGGGGGTMRFMLPTFGLYIVAGLWLVRQCTMRVPWQGVAAVAAALVGLQFLWGVTDLSHNLTRLAYEKEMLTRITVALEKVAQPGDVVVTNDAIAQQLDFVRKWKVADQAAYRMGMPPGAQAGGVQPGPVAGVGGGMGGVLMDEQGDNAVPDAMQIAKQLERAKHYTGTQTQRERKYMADILRWAGDHKVWLVGPEGLVMQYSSHQPGVPPQVMLARRVELPDAPPMPGPGGRGGAGGAGRGGRGGQGQGPQGPGQPGMGPQGPGFVGQGNPQGPGMGPQGPGFVGNPGQFVGGQGPQGPGFNPGQGGQGPGFNQGGPGFNQGPGDPGFNQGPGPNQGPGIGQGRGGRGLAGGQPLNGRGNGQGPGGQGPGAPGGGPMRALNGLTEVVIAEWILK